MTSRPVSAPEKPVYVATVVTTSVTPPITPFQTRCGRRVAVRQRRPLGPIAVAVAVAGLSKQGPLATESLRPTGDTGQRVEIGTGALMRKAVAVSGKKPFQGPVSVLAMMASALTRLDTTFLHGLALSSGSGQTGALEPAFSVAVQAGTLLREGPDQGTAWLTGATSMGP